MSTKKAEQVSLNEAIEQVTGEPTPANTIPIPVHKRTRSKPGTVSLFVALSEANYARLVDTADGRPINVWLSRLIERYFDVLVQKGSE